ncbi:ABC transporter ATP-binding protein [Aerococcus suis]|uniref:Putative ABC transport system ATP-binding protein n=1 Tax=Aerococcus suis TaxID=371602 RepID=A0A1W1ZAZ2_9LACT|nr:ABC transporter ATP-binding protein [Aerococcus suis]MCI7240047.1 ABC transporter ATP-binding protein [Aerococcus suis]MDD7758306.1 ABC transporter ATP-binding protein [Aerococcus suis]MDY4646756.1 ABC transporter ATP-binding protein [Aerococcus suis]SMC45512.1 putative ABC transport system ATP-binding protein [Aerococcus suis]
MSAITFKNITRDFKDGGRTIHVLKDTNVEINSGEFVAIVGPSGSGKSTFLTIAGGLQTPTSGEVYINGQELSVLSEKEREKLRLNEVGFILQASNLVPFLKVNDQFNLFDRIMKDDRSDYRDELLEQLGIKELSNKYPEDLSGGEQQRVAIAKALYNDPTILLADEPTASLDTERALEVVDILAKEAKEQDKAIIMVTHDKRLLDKCDRVLEMKDGELNEVEE